MIQKVRTGVLLMVVAMVFPLGSHSGMAQSFNYGIKGGLSSSTVGYELPDENLDLDLERRRGFSAFVFGEWEATSVVSLLGEIGYAQRGFRTPFEIRNTQGERLGEKTQTTSFGYATTSLFGKARYQGSVTPYLLAGPHLGVLLHSSFDTPGSKRSENSLTRQYDSLTFGGTVGIGIETDRLLPGTTTFLEARFGADVVDSLSDAPAEYRNRTIDVLLGLTF